MSERIAHSGRDDFHVVPKSRRPQILPQKRERGRRGVSVNAKDAVRWMANATVQTSLADIWRTEATAWLVA